VSSSCQYIVLAFGIVGRSVGDHSIFAGFLSADWNWEWSKKRSGCWASSPVNKFRLGLGRLPMLGLTSLESNSTVGKALCSGFVSTSCFGVSHPHREFKDLLDKISARKTSRSKEDNCGCLANATGCACSTVRAPPSCCAAQERKQQLSSLQVLVEAPRIYFSLPVLPSSDDTAFQARPPSGRRR